MPVCGVYAVRRCRSFLTSQKLLSSTYLYLYLTYLYQVRGRIHSSNLCRDLETMERPTALVFAEVKHSLAPTYSYGLKIQTTQHSTKFKLLNTQLRYLRERRGRWWTPSVLSPTNQSMLKQPHESVHDILEQRLCIIDTSLVGVAACGLGRVLRHDIVK